MELYMRGKNKNYFLKNPIWIGCTRHSRAIFKWKGKKRKKTSTQEACPHVKAAQIDKFFDKGLHNHWPGMANVHNRVQLRFAAVDWHLPAQSAQILQSNNQLKMIKLLNKR